MNISNTLPRFPFKQLLPVSIFALLLGCSAGSTTRPGAPHAVVKGFRTICYGKLWILNDDSRELSMYYPPGEVHLRVLYESEPAPPDEYPVGGFLCSDLSEFELTFEVSGKREYRLRASPHGDGDYAISAHELLEKSGPESSSIPVQVEKRWSRQVCQFYPPHYNCL